MCFQYAHLVLARSLFFMLVRIKNLKTKMKPVYTHIKKNNCLAGKYVFVLFIRKNEYAFGTYFADNIGCSDINVYSADSGHNYVKRCKA